MTNNLKSLWDKAHNRARERNTYIGLLGKHNPDTTTTLEVAGRADYLWVTLENKTVTQARNEAGVPQTVDLPIKLRLDHGTFVIEGRSNAGTLSVPTPTPPSGVLAHTLDEHTDVVITAPVADEILKYNGSEWVNDTGGGGAVDSVNGFTGTVVLDPDDLDDTATTNKFTTAAEISKLAGIATGANLYVHPNHTGDVTSVADGATTIAADAVTNSKAANMAADTIKGRANGAGTGDPTDLTATQVRTIINVENGADVTDAGNIASSITGVSTDDTIVDADVWGYLTGGVLVKTTWANIKAVLKTYLDGFYGLLATANTWTANNAFNSTASSGSALSATRNQATTTGPVLDIKEDNAASSQPVARLTGDGTGDILQMFAGASQVAAFDSAGNLGVGVAPNSALAIYLSAATGRIRMDSTGNGQTVGFVMSALGASGTQRIGGFHWQAHETSALAFFGISADNSTFALKVYRDNKVGINIVPTTALGLQAGTSTNDAAVGGVLYTDATTVGNVTTGEDIIMLSAAAYSVPASTLAVNGQTLWFEFRGMTASNGNTKTIRTRFGTGTNLVQSNVVGTSAAVPWFVRGRIVRTSSTTVNFYAEFYDQVLLVTNAGSLTQTLSGNLDLRITGEGTSTNDITCSFKTIGWDDNNT